MPSDVPSSAPTTLFNWHIEPRDDLSIVFGDDSSSGEIQYSYRISNRAYSLEVFESDCQTNITDGLVDIVSTATPLNDNYASLDIALDVDTMLLTNSSLFSMHPMMTKGSAELCVRLDLLSPLDGVSVAFHESVFVIGLDFSSNFTTIA